MSRQAQPAVAGTPQGWRSPRGAALHAAEDAQQVWSHAWRGPQRLCQRRESNHIFLHPRAQHLLVQLLVDEGEEGERGSRAECVDGQRRRQGAGGMRLFSAAQAGSGSRLAAAAGPSGAHLECAVALARGGAQAEQRGKGEGVGAQPAALKVVKQ